MSRLPRLRADQALRVARWFPGATLVADRSWNLVDRVVLHINHDGTDVLIKAGGPDDHHMDREIHAYERWVGPLSEAGRAPTLLNADHELRLLAVTYLPGVLAEGEPEECDPETHRQAGRWLRLLHSQGSRSDADYELPQDQRALAWLDGPHRIEPPVVEKLRAELSTPLHGRPCLVPTHGDWQPRNWIVHGGRLSAIDFGRADWRTADTDLARLAAQQWRGRPDLERAFLHGYGEDPRVPVSWRRVRLREAVGTAVWAHMVGDVPFEAQGHRMIAELLGAPSTRDG